MNASSITIRSATAEDARPLIEFLGELQEEKYPGLFASTRPLPTLEEKAAWIRGLLDYKTSHIWVGCAEGPSPSMSARALSEKAREKARSG